MKFLNVSETLIIEYGKNPNADLSFVIALTVIPIWEAIPESEVWLTAINEYEPPSNSGAMFISASKIRDSINNGDNNWKNMVDESLHSDIENYLS